MKSILSAVIFMFSMYQGSLVQAHGEDKPGPHGGFIRMPGAFHTEIIPISSSRLKVYLLDIHWQNPTVQNSSLKITHKVSKSEVICKPDANYFICQFPKPVDFTKKGELIVEAIREKQKGMEVSYELPLSLQKKPTEQHHGNHH